jgi:hypothetical protein
MADVQSPHQYQQPAVGVDQSDAGSDIGTVDSDDRNEQERKADNELAERLSAIIEESNRQVIPICKMIRTVSDYQARRGYL